MNLLLIGVVLLAATVHHSDAHNYEELLAKLNYDRREHAKARNISNMFKLEWNEKMAEETRHYPFKLKNFNPNFRVFFVGKNKDAILWDITFSRKIETRDYNHNKVLPFKPMKPNESQSEVFEKLVPTQKVIGCSLYNRSKERTLVSPNTGKITSTLKTMYTSICFIGPHRNIVNEDIFPKLEEIETIPCDEVEDGLCVSKLDEDFEIYNSTSVPKRRPSTRGHELPGPTVDYSANHGYAELLAKLNYERREYAKAMNISNMYKLVSWKWSEKLAVAGKTLPEDWKYFQPNFRHFYVGRNEDAIVFESYVSESLEITRRKKEPVLNPWASEKKERKLNKLEYLVPLQTSIGCAPSSHTIDAVAFGKNFTVKYSSICLIGPEYSFENSSWEAGSPASFCRYSETEDGLCISENDESEVYRVPFPEKSTRTTTAATSTSAATTTTAESTTSTESTETDATTSKTSTAGNYSDLVVKLNYDRREYAKAKNVANMFKLEWSETLAEIAKKFSTDRDIPRGPYRFFHAGRDGDTIDYETKFTNAINDIAHVEDWEDMKKYTARLEHLFIPALEQLVPMQRNIGCAPWAHPSDFQDVWDGRRFDLKYSTVCIIGPESSFKNATRKVGLAGSWCNVDETTDSAVNDDGLCVFRQSSEASNSSNQ
ncbi:hypothetical protein CRE_05068 [Caenorhabditis remanei]|uniref:Uncharacterized protein n=1 Tax=Caenorhabditis remanei TaxID=31234 RepID=E3MZ12_CAERE|nr:hypothetical protein CRE_05068 [Caenorhabditis remanei]